MNQTSKRNKSSRSANNSRPRHKSKGNFNRSRSGKSGRFKKQSIHPSKFVNKAKPLEVIEYKPVHTFDDFELSAKIKDGLRAHGYITPSAIQDKALPLALAGKDVIGLANTGTGKTISFLLPVVQKLTVDKKPNSVLIITPTRELAQQVHKEFMKFAQVLRLFASICVGGSNIERQIRHLKRKPHVIIGTPGRLKDLMSKNILKLDNINTFVLDEADRMLDMGFLPDIREIASKLPKERQTMCLSATMTDDIMKLVHDFMQDPETVSVRTADTSESIEQSVIEVRGKDQKYEKLLELLRKDDFQKVLVFGETKFGVANLATQLTKDGIASESIHGNKSQAQRQRALRAFKNHRVEVLIATDVAARGLDIDDVSHVINFDTPQCYDDYVHRIGRTGRGGKSGIAITFVPPYK